FTFAKTPSSVMASVTYVEGPITQDTVWTLTDSPFVVSKEIIVYPGVTLTIEPGVEIRFGGDFSLTVEGSLYASGTENRTITFTSNKDDPGAGDWNTIEFRGTSLSTLKHCVVQYAQHAVTVNGSWVTIEDCEIAHNFESGISVTGDNQATIGNNEISSNKNGILLTGTSAKGVTVTENIVMSNTESGIKLNADNYTNLVIQNNILSANHHGFHISGEANTNITKNSISYNSVGFFYTESKNHTAYYNDIYGNELGMRVSASATVNAEYNYWGHESGPYHVSLNPAGEGDPVGGDGVNLDFIFFLTAPIGYINNRPEAKLLTDKRLVPPNQAVTFIATTSSDDGRVDKFLFNFGDGTSSGWTTLSILVHEYSSTGTYNATVTVMDDFGVTSTNDAIETMSVQNLNPLQVTIAPDYRRVSCEEEVPITVNVTYATGAAENADVTLFALSGGNLTYSSGITDANGSFTTTFIAPNVTQVTNVRITATASKSSYADGSDYMYVTVLRWIKPKVLVVELAATPTIVNTEETSDVVAYVTYHETPISGAIVTMSSAYGAFSPETGTTNVNGRADFVFTAPQTAIQLHVNITATAAKANYTDGEGQLELTINPTPLDVQAAADPLIVESEAGSTITVRVTCDATPITDAVVAVSSDGGGHFSADTGTTDSDGMCVFSFTAPQTSTQLFVNITITATKIGYLEAESRIIVTVNPRRGIGLPLTTIIIIAVLISVVVVVIVLLKMKVISISWRKE
ncbi:MAG: right-handed parallel beta-helix repeat-containing protein, partial [Candidatus Bathyarchaeota archaeon]|nr:right-handed parallel beta-helix repeat-containing protein [Candidatus Bathyarchaeota archaeon]